MTDPDIEIILPDDDKILVCPRCYTHNPEVSNFCLNCGLSLRKGVSNRAKWIWLMMSVMIFIGGIYYFYFRISKLESRGIDPNKPQSEIPVAAVQKDIVVKEDTSSAKDEIIAPDPQKMKIPVGTVVIKDIAGKVINEVPVAVIAGGWIALPKHLCLGGAEWLLKLKPDTELSIESGIYSDYDKVGLWRVIEDLTIEGPELYPWAAAEPLTWVSLTSQDSPEEVELNNPDELGLFMEGVLRDDFNEIGILFQQDRIVGWTFGNYIAGAFVWNGDEGKYLVPEIRVDDFYRITFADSREEEFTRALALGTDYSSLERLEAFVNGFKFEARLAEKDRPDHLQKGAVIEKMRTLVAEALNTGNSKEVADIFDIQVLVEVADSVLLMDIARATAQSYGYEDAIELFENVIAGAPQINEQDAPGMKKFFSGLYQNWVGTLFQKGYMDGAWRAFRLGSRRLPEDVDIHLLGVQLALAENDWAEAEKLLAMKEYPRSLNDKIQNLQAQISDLKAQEGKIVIQFTPGSRHIPATAVINRIAYQKFIVDTGASMVTIPMSTAQSLGLTVDERNPLRKVFTAGGVKYAPEVVLSSITVEGWEINDVKALVLDLPNQSDMGLLGLNYLQRFRMDINSEKGTLMLEPR